jgi:hypothetical protein
VKHSYNFLCKALEGDLLRLLSALLKEEHRVAQGVMRVLSPVMLRAYIVHSSLERCQVLHMFLMLIIVSPRFLVSLELLDEFIGFRLSMVGLACLHIEDSLEGLPLFGKLL